MSYQEIRLSKLGLDKTKAATAAHLHKHQGGGLTTTSITFGYKSSLHPARAHFILYECCTAVISHGARTPLGVTP